MSDFEKIQEQEDVINSHDQNLVVSASAGSGKTSVMIRKILDYILNYNITVKDILVLTYTNFASEEMKQRLVSALKEVAPMRQDVFMQLDDIPLADISTFDSFCQKIVKKYFYLLDIDPSFTILSCAEETFYQNRAMKKAIEVYKKNNEQEYFSLFNCFADNRTDKNIYDLVLTIYNFSCSVLNFDDFKQKALSLFENNKAEELYKNYIDVRLRYIKDNLNKLFLTCKGLELEKHCIYISSLLVFVEFILTNSDFGKIIDYCTKTPFPLKPRLNDEYMDKIVEQKDALKSIVDTLKSYASANVYESSKVFCKEMIATLLTLCDEFKNRYDAIKKSKNMYDFNDIERLTIKVLEHSEIKDEIKNRYKKIFIDEFQDANLIQEKIISLIQDEGNLFLVGDLKQAIYGFRQSNSKIFENIIKKYSEDNLISGKSNALKLNSNFRTQKEILNFVNNIFSKIMTTRSVGLNYKQDALLVPKAKFLEEDYNVELDIVYEEKEDNLQDAQCVYSVSADISNILPSDKIEASLVAEKITKLLNENIYDTNLKKYRKINYSDICILFRTRNRQAEFVEVFEKYGIPLVENSNLDLEETYDVKVLINAIKVCENFYDDYALASVMMSPLFDFSSAEMLEIRKGDGETFYECVKNYTKKGEIKDKICSMQNILEKFYEDYTFKGLYFALTSLVNATNYIYKLSYLDNGISRKNNISTFIDSFVNSSFNFAANEYLSFLKQNTRKIKVTSEVSSFDCVTLTTMHSSKGLEWPIVFCVNLGQDFNRSTKTNKILLNEDIGMGIKYFDQESRRKYESIYYELIKQKNYDDDFAEKLRLLYVALTRAKNKLYLIGTTKKLEYSEFNSENEILYQKTYLDLIVKSLDKKSIDNINNAKNGIMFDNDKLILNVIKNTEFSQDNTKNIDAPTVEKGDETELATYINTDYKYRVETSIAQKNSVSGILRDEYEYTSQNFAPSNLLVAEHLNNKPTTDEGILYHKILEQIDFNKEITLASIEDIINSLKDNKQFDEELLVNVNKNLVLENALIVKDLTKGHVLLKEYSFVMEICYDEIENSPAKAKVLVQGVCDLVAFKGDEAILVDYKFSSKSNQRLLTSYNKQLYLYKTAIEKGLNKKVKSVYILSLKNASLLQTSPHK